jgi:rare lipoprotein A
MPMRRTLSFSLACLVISAGAIANTPEARSHQLRLWNHPSLPGSCQVSHSRHAAHHGRQAGQSEGAPYSDDAIDQAPADTYLGPMYTAGPMQIGSAAWYNWVGSRTASGEILDNVTATAAHRSLPLASYAKVTNLDNGRTVIVKINDRGPRGRRFIIDLSPRAAEAIGVIRTGVAAVMVEPVALGSAPSAQAVQTVAAF